MPITFAVDDVTPAANPRATRPLREFVPEAVVLAGDASTPVIDHEGVHPLLAAVHIAFAEHRSLVLSPDVLWITIAQGVAQHVRLNAERLRSRLVRGSNRAVLEVVRNGPPPRGQDEMEWTVDAFRTALDAEIGPGLPRAFVCDFSTTTRTERLVSEVVLLDAFSPYFDLKLACVCGIPEVTLLGIPEDYRKIRERIDVVSELDLHFWRPSLVRIADELLASSEGRPDRAFWRGIYKPKDAYGLECITGWIARLFPYVKEGQRLDGKNPLLDLPFDFEALPSDSRSSWYAGPGVTTAAVPASLSRAIIDVHDLTRSPPTRMNFCIEAGLTHIEQDGDGRLVPRAGYWLREHERSIHEVIERVRTAHVAVPSDRPCPQSLLPAEVVALYDHVKAATLFDGPRAWRLRPLEVDAHGLVGERGTIEVPRHIAFCDPLQPLFDLPDDRILCAADGVYVCVPAQDVWLHPGDTGVDEITGLERTIPPRLHLRETLKHIGIVAHRLTDLLTRVLDEGPDVQLPVLGNLAELHPPLKQRKPAPTTKSS